MLVESECLVGKIKDVFRASLPNSSFLCDPAFIHTPLSPPFPVTCGLLPHRAAAAQALRACASTQHPGPLLNRKRTLCSELGYTCSRNGKEAARRKKEYVFQILNGIICKDFLGVIVIVAKGHILGIFIFLLKNFLTFILLIKLFAIF